MQGMAWLLLPAVCWVPWSELEGTIGEIRDPDEACAVVEGFGSCADAGPGVTCVQVFVDDRPVERCRTTPFPNATV